MKHYHICPVVSCILIKSNILCCYLVKMYYIHNFPILANAPKKIAVTVFEQKHVHCVTRASNFFPKAVLHN